jgi:Gly-Xaa carboxypeptidase
MVCGVFAPTAEMKLIPSSTTVETLLEKDFKPTRTIVLAFGFDEEASGLQASNTAPSLGVRS